MGCCFSTRKKTGPNTTTTTTTSSTSNTSNTTKLSHNTIVNCNNKQQTHNNNNKNHPLYKKDKSSSRHQRGVIPCGKRTDFGYDKDFEMRYTIGKLLGHGQFGYTYVATDKSNGDRVAVKKIDKNKVLSFIIHSWFLCWLCT